MAGVLWGIVIVAVVLWVLGKLVFGIANTLIHLLRVVAIVVVLYNLTNAGASRRV